jgi:hypothetical protein
MEKLFTKVDLGIRWGVSRQVVNNWSTRREDFPAPAQYVSGGAIPLYLESSIKLYEEKRGILINEEKADKM